MANTTSIQITLPKELESHYAGILATMASRVADIGSLRARMTKADNVANSTYTQSWAAPTDSESKIEAIVPIVNSQVGTALAFLSKTFLSSDTIFPIVSAPEADKITAQFNTLISNYADDFQWRRNLLIALGNGLRYPVTAVECTWETRKINKAVNKLKGSTAAVATEATVKAGFRITALNMYNTFWDMNVLPARVAEDGEYAGYVEALTGSMLLRKLQNLGALEVLSKEALGQILQDKGLKSYYMPLTSPTTGAVKSAHADFPFEAMFGIYPDGSEYKGDKTRLNMTNSLYEVVTIYYRMLPCLLGLTEADLPGININSLQIFKFVIVGGRNIAYAEVRTNAHEMIPIFFGQPFENGLGYATNSLSEDLLPLQNTASSLLTGDLLSMSRLLADRGFYNPEMVDADDINSASVTKKIPVKNMAYGRNLSEAYYPIPFEDRLAGTRIGAAQQISVFSQMLSGQNAVTQGQFVKGNKTNSQFDQVINNSSARQVQMALLLEDQFFSPIKNVLMSDMLQYQEPLEILDRSTGTKVQVNPAELRNAIYRFEITDGLIDVAKVASTESLQLALQALQANPQLAMGYNLPDMFSHLMSLLGIKDLDDFKLPIPPQPSQPMQEQPNVSEPPIV